MQNLESAGDEDHDEGFELEHETGPRPGASEVRPQVRLDPQLIADIDHGVALFGCSTRDEFLTACVRSFMDRNSSRYHIERMALLGALDGFQHVVEMLAQSSLTIAEVACRVEAKQFDDLATAVREVAAQKGGK